MTPLKLSGITVPHHLVAADLIALAFRMTESENIDKVIVLFPDHFKRARLPFATSRRGFDTVFGRIATSQPDVRVLLQERRLVEESDLFASDHGIGAVLPFIRHYLPAARIVPIAVSIGARKDDLDRLAARLKPMASATTLIVQSTDFSHYRPLSIAIQRDQEVLNVLAAGQIDGVLRLRQTQHMDSRGAQYLQMRLQREVFRADPTVLFNSNSQAYVPHTVERTTSYLVQLFGPAPARNVGRDAPGSRVYCFAGDTFFGRGMLKLLSDPAAADRIRHELQNVLNDCRLIVNLTGVMVPDLPINLEPHRLVMPEALTLNWLKSLNVVAASVANNHSMDLGRAPFDAMVRSLAGAGIAVLQHGDIADVGPFRIAAFTDIDNWSRRNVGVIGDADIERLAHSNAKPPLFAMVSWGAEYEINAGPRELVLMEAFRTAAVSLIVGVRPHRAAKGFDLLGGGATLSLYSLGNFLFDQSSRRASGTVLEVRVFDQGTFFARSIPIPNVYEHTLGAPSGN